MSEQRASKKIVAKRGRGRPKKRPPKPPLFDERCLDLARHFYPHGPTKALIELAEEFQNVAENSAPASVAIEHEEKLNG